MNDRQFEMRKNLEELTNTSQIWGNQGCTSIKNRGI